MGKTFEYLTAMLFFLLIALVSVAQTDFDIIKEGVVDELPKDLVDKAQPIIGRAHLTASGARPSGDRIKIAGFPAKNLLFIGDTKQFDEVMKVIEGEIKFTTGFRGLQHDYSFHHREDKVNNQF